MTAVPLTAARTRAVVVADLDGTLAFDGHPPGPRVAALLAQIIAAPDLRLVLATSRPPPAVRRLVGALVDEVALLCCNGAVRVPVGGPVERTPLPGSLVETLVAELRAVGHPFCLDYGYWFAASSADAVPWKGQAERRVLDGPVPPGAVKLTVPDAAAWLGRFRRLCRGRAALYPHATTGDLDVSPRGCTKATALRRLLGDHRPRVIALGNDANDLDLLVESDAGVVVGDALPELDRRHHVERVPARDASVSGALAGVLSG